jgi:biotin-(acetyl-CoA carboxylase) ligase
LEIKELSDTNEKLMNQLELQNQDNEKLMQEAAEAAEALENMQNELEEALFEAEQNKKYQVFEEYYKQEVEKGKELTIQIEELAAEVLAKDDKLAVILHDHTQTVEEVTLTKDELFVREEEKDKLQAQVKELNKQISKMKQDYRVYE